MEIPLSFEPLLIELTEANHKRPLILWAIGRTRTLVNDYLAYSPKKEFHLDLLEQAAGEAIEIDRLALLEVKLLLYRLLENRYGPAKLRSSF